MAERKAVNKYYPPDWDPSKGSINKHVGQHPLRDRARKLDQGILIVRFELPFNIWCGGCDAHLATGLRFNAEKKRIGEYYSTPIWSFRMKCRFCSQWFEIHTDPKHSRYIVVRGARKKVEDYDGEDIDAITLSDEEEKARRVKDPMYSLEHRVLDKRKADEALERLTELKRLNDKQWNDPGKMNAKLRKQFRVGRKIRKAQQEESEQIQGRLGLNFPIMPEHEDDKAEAKLVIFGDPEREESQRLAALTAKPLVEKPPRKAPSIPDIRAATRKSDTKPTTKNNGGSSGGSGRGAGLDLKHAICISLRKRNDPFLDTQFGEPKTAGKTPSRTAAHQDALEPSTGNRSSGGAATVSLGVLVKKRSQQSEGVPAAKDAALDGLGHLTSADYQSSSDSE